MAIIAKARNGNFELPKAGTFQAVVFAVYDGGERPDKFKPMETVHKIRLGIELNDVYASGQFAGERVTRYPEYSLSLGDKSNLLPVVEAILQRPLSIEEKEGFDLENLIGCNCQVTIMHKVSKEGKEYADTSIASLMRGIAEIDPILQPNYKPEFIQKWQEQGMQSTGQTLTEMQQPDHKTDQSAPSKVQQLNSLHALKNTDMKKYEAFKEDWLKLGGSLTTVTDEQVTELAWKYL